LSIAMDSATLVDVASTVQYAASNSVEQPSTEPRGTLASVFVWNSDEGSTASERPG
jgi:hypothetical protein